MNKPNGFSSQILDVNSLPSLPRTLVELIDKCNKKDVNINDLGEAVARDVFISTRVLQLVNSAFIGARATFSDIVQAVIYLGVDTTRNLVVSVAVHETFKSIRTFGVIDLADFWRHSFLTAVLSKSLAVVAGGVHPAEAYLTGLLHDVGKLLLLNAFPEQYSGLLRETSAGCLSGREKESLEITHSEAAALLIRSWHLQSEISRAVLCHHKTVDGITKESEAAKILFCANQLSHSPLPDISPVAENVCTILNMNPAALAACIKDALAAVEEIAGYMGGVLKKGAGTATKPVRPTDRKGDLAGKVLAFSRLNGFLDNLVKADNLNTVYQVIEKSLYILFAIEGCLLFLPEENGGLKSCGSADNPLWAANRDLRVDIADAHGMLFQCLEHVALIDSFSFAKEKGLSVVDKNLLEIFGTDGLMTAPIVIAGHQPGVLVIGGGRKIVNRVYEGKETLLLLTGYSGMRLRLENTFKKHASELAATRVKAVTEVAKSLAHEINNPIATLQNYLTMLGVKLESRPDLAADLKIIGNEVDKIGQISGQLWDLSSQENHLQLEPVDLNILLADVVTFFRQSVVQKQGIDLGLSRQEELPVISSNGVKIRQILSNLIKNAIEAIETEGLVSVGAKVMEASADLERKVQISVEDTGPGVGFADVEDIFLPGITTKEEGHAGLGLAIAGKLAKQLGGELHCIKKQPGGMIFTFTLPV